MFIRKTVILSIILVLNILLLSGCNTFSGPPETEDSVKQKVETFLLSKGYQLKDFHVDVKYHKSGEWKYGGPYAIDVVFNDEPNVIYNYKYNYKSDKKDIFQIGVTPMKDKDDKNFKHAE